MAEFLTWIYLALAACEISHEKYAKINKANEERAENKREVPKEIEKFCCIISRYLLLPLRAGQIKSQQCLQNEPKIKHKKEKQKKQCGGTKTEKNPQRVVICACLAKDFCRHARGQ